MCEIDTYRYMGRLWMREGDFLVQIAMVTVRVAMVLGVFYRCSLQSC